MATAVKRSIPSTIIKTFKLKEILFVLKDAPKVPLAILLIFIIFGIFGRLLVPHDPLMASFEDALSPPFWMEGGSTKYLLGTDNLGRDLLSRVIIGAGISLEVGILVVVFAGIIGSAAAISAGFLGGMIDTVIMRLVDMIMSMPFLILAVSLAAVLGPSKYNLIMILAFVGWAWYARVLRSEVLSLKEADFIKLAIVGGLSTPKIMIKHIFPNIVNSLVILATLNLGVVIIAEASLSFLGLGVPPPEPAWGSMISEGRNLIDQAWWLVVFPGGSILLVVLSFNLLGDWLRVRLDPKYRQI